MFEHPIDEHVEGLTFSLLKWLSILSHPSWLLGSFGGEWALASETALAAGIAFLGGIVQAFDRVVSAIMVTAIQDLFTYRLSPVLPVEERVSALIPIYNLTATSESSFSIPTR